MKLGFKRGQKGFTLIEIIIVLAVLGVLAAVVVPNVTGFLGRGKERGWNSDRDTLQAAVDSYRTDVGKRAHNAWPTLGNLIGTPTDSGNATANTADLDYRDVGDLDSNYEPSGLVSGNSTTNEDLNSFIDITALVTDRYLKSAAAVKSVDTRLNSVSSNLTIVTGSYGWYIDSNGLVNAICWNDLNNDGKVDSGEVISTPGYQTDIYP